MLPLRKVIIPAAGLGTRLLSATKELPKEMLSVFSPDSESGTQLKPVVQLIYEQLFDSGFREFCFVVGRGKRAIEDHFTPDVGFVELLRARGKRLLASQMETFYSKLLDSKIVWVNQPEPRGFGDAVLCARSFAGDAPVLVHAGDNYILSPGNDHFRRMLRANEGRNADATLLLRHVSDPRKYGVAEVISSRSETLITRVVEKPRTPKSKLALFPAYLFEPIIFDILSSTKPGKFGELQLTDGIQGMIDRGLKVNAMKLKRSERWLDVGTPETYWEALSLSHEKQAR